MMKVKRTIAPEDLPSRMMSDDWSVKFGQAGKLTFSAGFIRQTGLKQGDKLMFLESEEGIFYMYKSDSGFRLKAISKKYSRGLELSNSALNKLIGEAYSFRLSLERSLPSFTCKIEVYKSDSYIIAGVDTYYRIVKPKKYEAPK
jgi:hypothetical protein